MDDETQSSLVLALGNAVGSLIEQAQQQQRDAHAVLAKSGETINEVSRTSKEYRELANALPQRVKEVITSSLDEAATKAAEILASKFTEADKQAQRAAIRYENAARRMSLKIIAIATVTWVLTVATVVFIFWYTSTATQALRQDRAKLESVMEYLNHFPKGTRIARCGDNLCTYVRTTKSRGTWMMLAVSQP